MQYYHVYVILSEKGDHYIGYTKDIEQRLEGHNRGDTKSTKNQRWHIVYYESYLSRADARLREKRLKHDGRARYQLYKRIEQSMSSGTQK